jgi:hypothetical protein
MRAVLTAISACLWLSAAWSVQHQPAFQDFAVASKMVGSPASPKVSSGRAHMYRTLLRKEGSKPPNFAGHYRIVTWGCGTCCNEFAIVNSQNGEVYFSPFVVACYETQLGIDFKPDSRLLVITGARNEKGGGRYFYEWTGKGLNLLLALEPK